MTGPPEKSRAGSPGKKPATKTIYDYTAIVCDPAQSVNEILTFTVHGRDIRGRSILFYVEAHELAGAWRAAQDRQGVGVQSVRELVLEWQ
jgi:hypothetical protein